MARQITTYMFPYNNKLILFVIVKIEKIVKLIPSNY